MHAEYKQALQRFQTHHRAQLNKPELVIARLAYFQAGFDFIRTTRVEETIRRMERAVSERLVTQTDAASDILQLRYDWSRYQQELKDAMQPVEARFDRTHLSQLADQITQLDWDHLWSNKWWLSIERGKRNHIHLPMLGHHASSVDRRTEYAAKIYTQRELRLQDAPLHGEMNGIEFECTMFVREMAQRAYDAVTREDYCTRTNVFEEVEKDEFWFIMEPINRTIDRLNAENKIPERPPSHDASETRIPSPSGWLYEENKRPHSATPQAPSSRPVEEAGRVDGKHNHPVQSASALPTGDPPFAAIAKSIFWHNWGRYARYSEQLIELLQQLRGIKTDLVGICATAHIRNALDKALRDLVVAIAAWQNLVTPFETLSKRMLRDAHILTTAFIMQYIHADADSQDMAMDDADLPHTKRILAVLGANIDRMESEFPPLRALGRSAVDIWHCRREIELAAQRFKDFSEIHLHNSSAKPKSLIQAHSGRAVAEGVAPWEAKMSFSRVEESRDFQVARTKLIGLLHHIFIGNLSAFQSDVRQSITALDPAVRVHPVAMDPAAMQQTINAARERLHLWERDPDQRKSVAAAADSVASESKQPLVDDVTVGLDLALSYELGGRYAKDPALAGLKSTGIQMQKRRVAYVDRIKQIANVATSTFKSMASDVFLLANHEVNESRSGQPATSGAQAFQRLSMLVYYAFVAQINQLRMKAGIFWANGLEQYNGEEVKARAPPRGGSDLPGLERHGSASGSGLPSNSSIRFRTAPFPSSAAAAMDSAAASASSGVAPFRAAAPDLAAAVAAAAAVATATPSSFGNAPRST